MPIEKEPFRKYKLDEENEDRFIVISTKWNDEEIDMLMKGGLRLRQTKKATIIKMLAKIGYAKVVQDNKMIDFVLDSYRRNKRLGIPEVKTEIQRNFGKSNTNSW